MTETPSTETTILTTVNYDLQEQVSSKMIDFYRGNSLVSEVNHFYLTHLK